MNDLLVSPRTPRSRNVRPLLQPTFIDQLAGETRDVRKDGTDGDESMSVSGQAVVIGGSIGGLCAARALQTCFARVTVVEADTLPDTPHRAVCCSD